MASRNFKFKRPFECSIQFDNDECLREYYGSEKFEDNFRLTTGHSLTKREIKTLTKSKKPFEQYSNICKTRNIPFSQTAEEQISKVQNRWTQVVAETNQNLKVCSFSLSKSSLLLWSHYSEEHKGICISMIFLILAQ